MGLCEHKPLWVNSANGVILITLNCFMLLDLIVNPCRFIGRAWALTNPGPSINYLAAGVKGSADLCTMILNLPSFPFLKTQVLSTITSFPSLAVTHTLPIVIATEP